MTASQLAKSAKDDGKENEFPVIGKGGVSTCYEHRNDGDEGANLQRGITDYIDGVLPIKKLVALVT